MPPVRGLHLLLILGSLLLSGCAPLVSSFPTATPDQPIPAETQPAPVPTATISPTPTIEWFPATPSPTPLPTAVKSPTPDPLAGAGELVYRDDFSDPSQWVIYQIVGSNITILNQDITFDLDENSGLAYAFRSGPLLTDYSARISASPSYCGEEDEYGLMVRVTGVRRDHYRFAVTCDGRAGVFRVVNEVAVQIADWVRHPVLARSFPSTSQLALRVEGRDLQFFVNDQLLISVQDAVISRGTVGLFVRAVSGEPVLVSFSELQVYAIGTAED
ncbi:MAG: hypothetical protein JW757_06495 [Anaerolineales bacterium]|nr:hypothetical protein [Anaerolineales bacterium]